ncbi:phage protein NinX family protein [Pseudomonas sp. JR33AA]|uniref:phage protein NinX family protein n=1 Tax=Pseudomonas sp. JR33AA TaxID=2899113 RepID=UPI001F27BD33|nr:phage protein NinX family protein [Pseudomonas sp. JR33AA]MCE5979097.1 DUF2591 domain-containing protein [Pseudomonas sp. JR33AA]
MTDLIEVKTADLAGEALGWAVGKAEGLHVYLEPPGYNGVPWRVFARYRGEAIEHIKRYNPWEDWELGGPLIDKYNGSTQYHSGLASNVHYSGGPALSGIWCYGPTALTAFLRSLTFHKSGSIVKIPMNLHIQTTTLPPHRDL